ncbi:hypothetical protein FQN52_008591 [Onygenales sp. PD_12]|nr:hypothetical protein FQN52_008591 [Onygenales sp. PD_12]
MPTARNRKNKPNQPKAREGAQTETGTETQTKTGASLPLHHQRQQHHPSTPAQLLTLQHAASHPHSGSQQKQKQKSIPSSRTQQTQQGGTTRPVPMASQLIDSDFPPLGSQPALARVRGKGKGNRRVRGGRGRGRGRNVSDTDNWDGGVPLNQTTTSLLDLDVDLDLDLPGTSIPQQQARTSGSEGNGNGNRGRGRGLLAPYNDLWTALDSASPQAGGNPHGGGLVVSNKDPVTDTIQQSPDYMYHFHSLIATRKDLREVGYVLEPLTVVEIDGKRRLMAKYQQVKPRKPENVGGKNGEAGRLRLGSKGGENQGGKGKEMTEKKKGDGPEEKKKVVLNCKFHEGRLRYKTWSCCGQHVSSPPCGGEPLHHPRSYQPGELASLWQFHRTPMPQDRTGIRTAVAIDCEMGQAMSGDSELIRITLIDYFSAEILIDSLVYPSVPMEHYRTSFSGVTKQDMERAMRSGTCIMGRNNARKAVWQYVGPNTIVVGHSANNDLDSLRWIHGVVVDTYAIANAIQKKEDEKKKREEEERKKKEEKDMGVENGQQKNNNKPDEKPTTKTQAEQVKNGTAAKPNASLTGDNKNQPKKPKKPKGSGKCSLKTLAKEKLGREIQNAGKRGHDSLEDAVAARDVANWYVSELMAAESGGGDLLL